MQHTLLPSKERSILRREYRIRVFIVFCFLVSVSGLIGVGTLFPTFLFAVHEEETQFELLKSIKKDAEDISVTTLELDFQRDNHTINALSQVPKTPRPSVSIQSVVGVRGTVKLNSISVNSPVPDALEVIIQGVAPNRDTLLAFKARLEELVPGGAVELPVSDLAKSKDLVFSMRITQTFK
ncbi:MAG: hypothetical protein AAB381_01245 [Patescibacteria group bacterium]